MPELHVVLLSGRNLQEAVQFGFMYRPFSWPPYCTASDMQHQSAIVASDDHLHMHMHHDAQGPPIYTGHRPSAPLSESSSTLSYLCVAVSMSLTVKGTISA